MGGNEIVSRIATVALIYSCILAGARAAEGDVDAMIPIEVLPVDSALSSGEIWVGGVRWSRPQVATQPARVARGIAVGDDRTRVYVLTLLGELARKPDGTLDLDVPPDRLAWCVLALGGVRAVFCYQDTDGDGTLDVERIGSLATVEALSLRLVGAPRATKRTAYRVARTDELPVFHIGYESCGSPVTPPITAATELRYSTAVRREEKRAFASVPPAVCNGVANISLSPDGAAVAEFGRFKVLLHHDGERITTSLLEGIAPGTLLGNLRVDQPLTDALQVAEARANAAPELPYLSFVAAPAIAEGIVQAGGTVLTGTVVHGITGTLKSDAITGFSRSVAVSAGALLFGAVMSARQPGLSDPRIVWCAPEPDPATPGSLCFVPGPTSYGLVENQFRYAIPSVISASGKPVLAPVVQRGPVDFGAPLVLSVRFDSADGTNTNLSWSVAPGDRPAWSELDLRRAADGSVMLVIAGLAIKVTATSDAKSAAVEVAGTWAPAEDATPLDGVRLLQRR